MGVGLLAETIEKSAFVTDFETLEPRHGSGTETTRRTQCGFTLLFLLILRILLSLRTLFRLFCLHE